MRVGPRRWVPAPVAADDGRRKVAIWAVAAVALLTGTSCGTRVDTGDDSAHAANTAAQGSLQAGATASTAVSAEHGKAAEVPGVASTSSTPPAEAPSSGTQAAGGSASVPQAATGSGTRRVPTPPTAAAAGRRHNVPAEPEKTAAPSPGSPAPAPDAGINPSGGPKSTIKLGLAGTLSGPAGSATLPMQQGVQIWAGFVNSRGGVNGHPVQIISADDGGDPARHQAQVKELIETHRVLAFINNPEALTGASSVDYITQKRVPVIGMSGAEPWAYSSPMYFPQASSGPAIVETLFASAGQQGLARGKKKLGVLTCTEIQQCRDVFEQTDRAAPKRGLEVVYKGRASLAQPDYTAECLSARNAGVEVLFIVLDGNSLRRVAASCARQAFRPLISTGNQVIADDMKNDPNLKDSLISNSTTFPYYQDGPSTSEFRQALQTFGKGVRPAGGLSLGWVSGKLFERAAANLPDPPTSEAILNGLWSINNDDLGGLTQPLTFQRDKPAAATVCWWNMAVRGGTWTSPDNFKRFCD